jgi:hypothetical protein
MSTKQFTLYEYPLDEKEEKEVNDLLLNNFLNKIKRDSAVSLADMVSNIHAVFNKNVTHTQKPETNYGILNSTLIEGIRRWHNRMTTQYNDSILPPIDTFDVTVTGLYVFHCEYTPNVQRVLYEDSTIYTPDEKFWKDSSMIKMVGEANALILKDILIERI